MPNVRKFLEYYLKGQGSSSGRNKNIDTFIYFLFAEQTRQIRNPYIISGSGIQGER